MSFGSRPTSSPPFRPRPSGRADERSAFAVGSRALVTPTPAGTAQVQLLDEDGLPTDLRLAADAGVVITAWRPRRMATPRYRVRSTEGVEGWIDATNLRRLPPPPPPPAPPVAATVPAKAAPAKAAPARPPAKKPATPAQAASRPPAKLAAKAAPKPAPKPAPKSIPKSAAQKPAKPVKAAKRAKPGKPGAKVAKAAGKKKSSAPARKRAR